MGVRVTDWLSCVLRAHMLRPGVFEQCHDWDETGTCRSCGVVVMKREGETYLEKIEHSLAHHAEALRC